MIVVEDLIREGSAYLYEEGSAVALGNFDGFHIGHREIINRCVDYARDKSLTPTVITFDPHPRSVLIPKPYDTSHKCISTTEEKLEFIRSAGVKRCIVVNFDLAFSRLHPNEFVEKYLIEGVNAKALFTGYNFCFGYNKSGNTEWLYKNLVDYGMYYEAVKEVTLEYQKVSSSNIKKLFSLGLMETASKILGRSYMINGVVEVGEGAGSRVLGVPTANIPLNSGKCYPVFGVYLCKIMYEGHVKYGVANLGVRPSLNAVATPLLEAHIFDFDGDLYGKTISVEPLQFIRPERKFPSLDGLIYQIKRDIVSAKYALSHILGLS